MLNLVFACWKVLEALSWNLSPERRIKIVLSASIWRMCFPYYIHSTKCILKFRINSFVCTCVPQALHSHPGRLLLLIAITSNISVTTLYWLSTCSKAWLSTFQSCGIMWEKCKKESFTVQWLLFHTVNLGTENQAHTAWLGSLAWTLLENTLWCDQIPHSSSSPNELKNSTS